MAEKSGISWTRSTFNPWIGCTKVGPGCDGCYAEALDARHRWKGATHWGVGVPRMRTSESNWNGPRRWNKLAEGEFSKGLLFAGRAGFWPVFCASLADVFDNEVPQDWREDLWDLIEATPYLTWQLVTKRVGLVMGMIPPRWRQALPGNVWIVATMVNQQELDRDLHKLTAIPAVVRGVSYEPALGPVDWSEYFASVGPSSAWIIVGGESVQAGHAPRQFDLGWAYSTVRQCKDARAAVFVKQLGSNPSFGFTPIERPRDRAGAEPAEWPEDLRFMEFPS